MHYSLNLSREATFIKTNTFEQGELSGSPFFFIFAETFAYEETDSINCCLFFAWLPRD